MDTITRLRAFPRPKQRMCKTFTAEGVEDYGRARNFQATEVPVTGLDELQGLLEAMQEDPWICAIRGTRRESVTPETRPELFEEKLPGYVPRSLQTFRDTPHHWLCVDVDHFTDNVKSLIDDPAGAVHEAVQAVLPFEFHNADYVWQLSNSAGFKPGVRVHLWFWLSEPRSSAVLKNWAAVHAPDVDRALFNPVQVHYTAAPVVAEGVECPIKQRIGRHRGLLGDVVELDIDETITALDGLIDLDSGEIDSPPDPREKNNYVGAFCRAWPLEDVLDQLLGHVFEPQDDRAGRLNFLLAEGAGAGGAFITSDGLHVVNKHNSDPFFNRAVNAFDLVRHYLHNGDGDDTNKSVDQRASYRDMVEYCIEDGATAVEIDRIPGLAILRAEDEFEPLEDAPPTEPAVNDFSAEHERVEKLISSSAANSFMSEVRYSEAHTASNAHEIWKADRVPEDTGRLFEKTGQGNPKNSLPNTIMVFAVDIMLRRCLGMDQFALRRALYGPLPWRGRDIKPTNPGVWNDSDYARLKYYIIETYNFTPTDQMLTEAMDTAAGWANFHPVQTHLNGLEWDGVSRLDTWLIDFCHVPDTAYARAVGARTLIGAVRRVFEPGVKHDTILVLEGRQGLMKSTAVEVLAGNSEWYREGVPDLSDEKKMVESLRGRWMVELPELSAMARVSTNEAKEVITRRTDSARLAYGREETVLKRQSIFIGTTNNREYLKDATGNRRYWPVALGGPIAIDALKESRDQIMAEAVHRCHAGERSYVGIDEPELMAEVESQQASRYEESPEEERLHEWLETPRADDDSSDEFMAVDDDRLGDDGRLVYVSRNDILQECFKTGTNTPPNVIRHLRQVITRYFERASDWTDSQERVRVGGKQIRAYHRKPQKESGQRLH